MLLIFFFSCVFILVHCLLSSDIKKLIALSSVFHIRLALYFLFLNSNLRVKIFYLVNTWHTLRRGCFFYLAGCLYYFTHTRLIYLFKFLKYRRFFFIFITCLSINAGSPPFFRLFLEVIMFGLANFKSYLYLRVGLATLILSIRYHLIILNNVKLKFFIKKVMLVSVKFLAIFLIFFNYWLIF